jgi:glutamine synthetase
MYADYKKYPNLPKLPNNVSEALNMLGNSKVLNKAFGKKNIDSYIKLKRNELDAFKKQGRFDKKRSVTKWEKDNTLDC